MKKLLFMAAIIFAANFSEAQTAIQTSVKSTTGSSHQKKEDKNKMRKPGTAYINELSKQNFAVDFKGITSVKWKKDEDFDVAGFTLDGKKVQAYYDINGELVGTITNTSIAELFPSSQKDIKKKYKDYTVTTVVRYDDNESNNTDMVLYATPFDEDSYFVELSNKSKKIILMVSASGDVSFFKNI